MLPRLPLVLDFATSIYFRYRCRDDDNYLIMPET